MDVKSGIDFKGNGMKLKIGDVVIINPSLIKMMEGLGYKRWSADSEYYIVTKVGRKYYYLFSYNSQINSNYRKRDFQVDITTLDLFLNQTSDFVTVHRNGDRKCEEMINDCINNSIKDLKKVSSDPSEYQMLVERLHNLADNLSNAENNISEVAKVFLTV